MKNLFLLLGLLALTGVAKAERTAVITTSTNTPQLFALQNGVLTPATYTAKSCLGKGVILTKLMLSVASGTTSTVKLYDSPDSTTTNANAVLVGQWDINISSSTTSGLDILDFTTAKSYRTDTDGLEVQGYPVLYTTAGVPVIAVATYRKGASNAPSAY